MIQSKRQLAQVAISEAMKVRQRARCGLRAPVCVYDLCERLDVSVWFHDIPSMEGVYHANARPKPAIVISSLRPAGRQAITCGHELGHHAFGHGEQFDELVEQRTETRKFEPDEFQADLFSMALHMPKRAVLYALSRRDLDPSKCSPESLYAISVYFGVSYRALIQHLEKTLGLIDVPRSDDLQRRQPKELRANVLGEPCPQNLHVVDFHWADRAIDAEAGDTIILPPESKVEGSCVATTHESADRTVAVAVQPGIGHVSHGSGWAAYIRIMRKDYVGRAPLRFDEEVDDDQ